MNCPSCDYFITCNREDKTPENHNCEYYKNTFLKKKIEKIGGKENDKI